MIGHAKSVAAAVALVALTTLVVSIGPVGAQQAAVVDVDAVRVETMSQTVPILGRLVPRQAGDVAARTSGPVFSFLVDVGDRVEKDDLIAEIDPVRIQAERNRLATIVSEAKTQVEQATAQAALRRQELRRLEGLRQSAAFSQGRYEDAQQEVIIAEHAISLAEARRASAVANLRLAQIDLRWAAIKAPYPGVITVVHTEVGAWLGVGQPVVTMLNDRDLEIEADVPSNRIGGLDPGVVVDVALEDGSEHMAVVRAVVPEENALTRTRQVRFTPTFVGTPQDFAANQTVTVSLPAGRARDALTVHKDAIVRIQGQAFVYVAQDGQAQIRPVQLGEAVGARFEVLGGVGPGEQVVVRGNERLQPGQPISIGNAG